MKILKVVKSLQCYIFVRVEVSKKVEDVEIRGVESLKQTN